VIASFLDSGKETGIMGLPLISGFLNFFIVLSFSKSGNAGSGWFLQESVPCGHAFLPPEAFGGFSNAL
jgi:hypothetical protein